MWYTLLLLAIFHFLQSVVFPLTKRYGEKWIDRHFKGRK